jgi:hypothetical protein
VGVTTPSGTLQLRTPPGQDADIFTAPDGSVSFQLAASDHRGDLFNVSGGAQSGAPLTDERISMLDLGPGLYFDTSYPSQAHCSTTFSTVTGTRLVGSITCDDYADGPTTRVTAAFRIG